MIIIESFKFIWSMSQNDGYHYQVKRCRPSIVLVIKRLRWRRWMSFNFTVISCGQHLSCCVWQLDLSMELRKLTSTASLSSCKRSCSERRRTSLTSAIRRVWDATEVLSLTAHWYLFYSAKFKLIFIHIHAYVHTLHIICIFSCNIKNFSKTQFQAWDNWGTLLL